MNLRQVWTEVFQKPAGRLILFLLIGGIFLAFILLRRGPQAKPDNTQVAHQATQAKSYSFDEDIPAPPLNPRQRSEHTIRRLALHQHQNRRHPFHRRSSSRRRSSSKRTRSTFVFQLVRRSTSTSHKRWIWAKPRWDFPHRSHRQAALNSHEVSPFHSPPIAGCRMRHKQGGPIRAARRSPKYLACGGRYAGSSHAGNREGLSAGPLHRSEFPGGDARAAHVAQRFLKSVMEQVGALAGQNPDDEEDDTIPSMSLPGAE